MKIHEMLQLGGVIDTGTGVSQDFTVSPDWAQVVQYDQQELTELGKPEAWSSTTCVWASLSMRSATQRQRPAARSAGSKGIA